MIHLYSRLPHLAFALTAFLTATFAAPSTADPPPPILDEAVADALAGEISGATAKLAAQEMTLHHRMRGSRGFRAAAEAIIDRLEAAGLQEVEILEFPADGEIFYGTQRSRPAWDVDFAELWELDDEGAPKVQIGSWTQRPVTVAQDSESGEADGLLVDVGAGVSESDYEGKNVRGALVLTSSQPGAAAALAVGKYGAAGLVSYAQNQRSAWWREDENLVRWGHLGTFPQVDSQQTGAAPTSTFAFMVSLKQARAWRERLARGEDVRLRARVEAGRSAGNYSIPTAVVRGRELPDEEILFSCHLDHQRPGANDNASGCAAILEGARSLAKLVAEGKLPAPRRTLRWIWPPEIEGTIAYAIARPELAAATKAVIHLDMVGGAPAITKSVFRITRGPKSLPTFVNDVAEEIGRWMNAETLAFAGGAAADYPLVDPEGGKEAWLAHPQNFTAGSDHQVWTEGSLRVPAIYLNDWPDRYIHTHADVLGNLDTTKLLRAAFLASASAYVLADLNADDLPDLARVLQRRALERAATAKKRAEQLDDPAEAANVLRFQRAFEREVAASVARFAAPTEAWNAKAAAFLDVLDRLLAAPDEAASEQTATSGAIYRRTGTPQGPLNGFGYSYLSDQLARRELATPRLLSASGIWGSDYAYEAFNLVDGRRDVGEIRDALSAIYGPIELDVVAEFLDTLRAVELLEVIEK